MNNLNLAIQSLPNSIFNWLANELVVLAILEINNRLKLTGEDGRNEVIPHLILRLCVQDLDPRDFVNELSHELDIGFESAKILTKELEEKILKPIEAPLKLDAGVDLKMLYLGKAELRIRNQESGIKDLTLDNPSLRVPPIAVGVDEAISSVSSSETQMIASSADNNNRPPRNDENKYNNNPLLNPKSEIFNPTPTLSNPLIQNKNQIIEKIASSPIAPRNDDSIVPLTPFILHEEINSANSQNIKETAKSSFSFKVPISQRPDQPITPPRAQIINPPANNAAGRPQQTKYPPMTIAPKIQRVVHYSQFITRIRNKELGIRNVDSEIKIPKSKWFV